MTHEQWETVAGAVDAAEVDERALHAARDAVASLRAEHAEMAALLASIAHGGAVSGGLSLNDAWSRERMRDEARALLAPYPGGSVVSGAPGEGPTNATHIFCRTCHGWWPRPDGCPHHGAPGEGLHLADDEGDQVGATFDPDKGYAVAVSGAPGEGTSDYSTLSAHEKHLMGAPGEGQPRRFFLELPLKRGEGVEDAEDWYRAEIARLLARAEAAEAAEAERDRLDLALSARQARLEAAEAELRTALEAAMEAAKQDIATQAKVTELAGAIRMLEDTLTQERAKVTALEAALSIVANDWRYRQRAIEEGRTMDDPDVVIERHGRLAEAALDRQEP